MSFEYLFTAVIIYVFYNHGGDIIINAHKIWDLDEVLSPN